MNEDLECTMHSRSFFAMANGKGKQNVSNENGKRLMSLPMRIKQKCSVCAQESEQTVLASTNTFGGGPDLDLRPAEMMRSTSVAA